MVYSELVTYIREQTQKGTPADALRQTLMETGWLERDIENAFHDVAAGLTPLTEGASLHEDVSQVRAMVAHLAARVRAIEAQLIATTGTLPMQDELPSGTIGPERELTQAPRRHPFGKFMSILGVLALFAAFGFYMTTGSFALAPRQQLIVAVSAGAVLLGIGIIAMRRHHAWTASIATATATAAWALALFTAWRTYHVLEWTTAAAAAALLVVLIVVMGRWIDRLAR